jgi:pyruvate formate lyase activating enzyme
MRIGGVVHNSLIDWEGKIVSVIFTIGCNFRCGYCHNPSLVLPDLIRKAQNIPIDEVLEVLEERKKWIDGVVVTGGEPTIHADLPDLLNRLKTMGLIIKLDTNGTNPEMIKEIVNSGLIDFVAMDIKTVQEEPEYNKIVGCHIRDITGLVKESIDLLRQSGVRYQFRTTVIPWYHSEKIMSRLKHQFRNDPYLLQQFRAGNTIKDYFLEDGTAGR